MTWDEAGAIVALSLQVAALSLLLIIPPGIFTAHVLARKQFPGKALLEALVHAPLVLPPVVSGYLLLLLLGKNGFIGAFLFKWFGLQLAFHTGGAVLAAAVLSFPLLVRPLRLAIELVDPGLETAAATLGASPLRILLTITWPLAAPGLISGLMLAFARGLGEFGATIIFAGNIQNQTRTIPLAIYTQLQTPGGETWLWLLVGVSVTLSVVALILSEWLNRRMALSLGRAP